MLRLHPHAIVVIVSGAEIAWATGQPRPDRPKDRNYMPDKTFRGKDKKVFSKILEDSY